MPNVFAFFILENCFLFWSFLCYGYFTNEWILYAKFIYPFHYGKLLLYGIVHFYWGFLSEYVLYQIHIEFSTARLVS